MAISFQDIPQFPSAHYRVNVPWKSLESTLADYLSGCPPLNMDPDYQRAHVWTEAQQVRYVEYVLRGGEVGRNITFNCPGWMGDFEGPFELVDGKQRLEAVRRFMRGDLVVFGHSFPEFTGVMRMHLSDFTFCVCSIPTRAEILELYLNINAGGTPHTSAELDRVRALYHKAKRGG